MTVDLHWRRHEKEDRKESILRRYLKGEGGLNNKRERNRKPNNTTDTNAEREPIDQQKPKELRSVCGGKLGLSVSYGFYLFSARPSSLGRYIVDLMLASNLDGHPNFSHLGT